MVAYGVANAVVSVRFRLSAPIFMARGEDVNPLARKARDTTFDSWTGLLLFMKTEL